MRSVDLAAARPEYRHGDGEYDEATLLAGLAAYIEPASLDAPLEIGDGLTWHDRLPVQPTQFEEAEASERRALVESLLAKIDRRLADVIRIQDPLMHGPSIQVTQGTKWDTMDEASIMDTLHVVSARWRGRCSAARVSREG